MGVVPRSKLLVVDYDCKQFHVMFRGLASGTEIVSIAPHRGEKGWEFSRAEALHYNMFQYFQI